MSSDQLARPSTRSEAPARSVGAPRTAGPVLLVSSSGGHFTELEAIAERRGYDDVHWVVPQTRQTEARLTGVPAVSWVPPVSSRDLRNAMRNLRPALRLHRELRPSLVVTAGAAQALPHLVAAALHRTPVHYVESVARLDAPSVMGRVAARLPRTRTFAPVTGWGRRWEQEPDVFASYDVTPGEPVELRSAVVALGSEKFPFPRAVRMVQDSVLRGADITWQIGSTHPSDGVSRNRWLKPDELSLAMSLASVVITHGGAGSVLTALAAGKVPVVLPRTADFGEHCDDHQVRMCEMLAERGLAVLVRPGERLEASHLAEAAARVVTRPAPVPSLDRS
ncbi:glycosyltransferase [Nocardioides sp. SYSU D00038]|uniref:glycosyltransferase n=1 Tax=Nocardioides sp. SYSU D00038 TaxID=2812554 RepID=UPI00196819B2|nr:glycosyltransferase [Nocardioides sp. SYSU D00038]